MTRIDPSPQLVRRVMERIAGNGTVHFDTDTMWNDIENVESATRDHGSAASYVDWLTSAVLTVLESDDVRTRLDAEFSADVSEWVERTLRPSSEGDPVLIGLKTGEESGELMGAILDRRQAQTDEERKYASLAVLAEAGDVLICLARLAWIEGTTLETIAEERWTEIKQRDGTRRYQDVAD